MASTESLIFDLLVRDRASDGLSKIGGSASSAAGNVDSLTKRLDDVGRKSVTARLALDGDKAAQAALDKIDARLLGLDRRTASPKLTVEGAARATAEVSALDLELDKLGKKGGSADVAASAVGSGSGGLAGTNGIMALVVAGVALSPVLVTTTIGLAGFSAAAYGAVAPILAAGTATAAQQKALAALDPAQRVAYTSLGALKGQFGEFTKELEPQVFSVFNQGLKLAGGLLGDVEPVAAATGKALGVLVGEIGADFKTSQWQQFFGWMAQTAGPDIQLLGQLFINWLNVLPPLLQELQPLATMLLNIGADAGIATSDLLLLNPALTSTSVKSAAVQTNSGNMFTRFLANSKVVLSQVTGIGKATGDTATGTAALAAAAAAAAPKVGTLSGDLAILGSSTALATDATKAFNDVWAIFVGKSVSDQQAVLAAAAAFDAYNASLKTNKANSTASQQAFLSIITTMGSGLSTLQTNGASVRELNSFYQTNIDKLKTLHNLTPDERRDIQNVTRDYNTWANSTSGLTRQTDIAAAALKNNFLAQIGSIAAHAPGVSGDVTNLATAILKTGTQSSATRADRQRLIDDLVQAGVKADAARRLVNGLQGQIDAMHGKTVSVGAAAHGSGSITATENILGMKTQKLGSLTFVAAGGKITGGTPGRDSVLAALMPGEVVVPAAMVQAGAVDHLKGRLPGFAAGGVVGQAIPDWMGTEGSMFVKGAANAGAQALVTAFLAAAGKAAAEAAPGVGSGTARWTPVVDQALSMLGLSLSLAGRVLYQMQTESGGNPRAINLSDFNARVLHDPSRGLMQVIGSTFAAFHVPGTSGDIYDPLANIAAALHYGELRYGPTLMTGGMGIGSGHGYDNGGFLPPGLSLAYNGTGVPEPVIPASRIAAGAGAPQTIIIKVDPAVAASTPDRQLGRHLAEHLAVFIKGGGRLYPPGTVPR